MCTIFKSDTKNIIAKSHDNFIKEGMIFTNKRGMNKKSLTMPGQDEFYWTSKYGSITFSQCGKGMPVNGMNEQGLVIEQATLPGTVYQETDRRPELSCLETIQYLLDTCATTTEVLDSFKNFRISKTSWTVHYFICDQYSDTLIIEFIDGNLKIYTNDKILVPILTNHEYNYVTKKDKFINENEVNEYQDDSMRRFKIVKELLSQENCETIEDHLNILKAVERNDTAWRCVYDIENKEIIYSLVDNIPQRIKFSDIDFTDSSKSFVVDLSNIFCDNNFIQYTREINLENIKCFFCNDTIIQMMNLPDSEFIVNAFDQHISFIEEQNTEYCEESISHILPPGHVI